MRILAIFSLLVSTLYWSISLPKTFFEFLKYFFSSQEKQQKLKFICFAEARLRILEGLTFLKDGTPLNSRLPWLHSSKKDNNSFFSFLKIHHDYIRSKWLAFPSYKGFFDFKNVKFDQVDLLTFYPDIPLVSLFDFNRFTKYFPDDLQKEYYLYHQKGASITEYEGNQNPDLLVLVQSIIALQTEWAGDYFIHPLHSCFNDVLLNPSSHSCSKDDPAEPCFNDDPFSPSLYHFSGTLFCGLMIMAEMAASIKSGLSFHPKYAKKLTEYSNTFFDRISNSNATLADLFFLHSAIERFWICINELHDHFWQNLFENGFDFSSKIETYQEKAPIFEQFKIFFSRNPVSPLLRIDFLCDARLIDPRDEAKLLKIGPVFYHDISDEVIFSLANHTFSGLMAPYMSSGRTCFGTEISGIHEDLFQYRMKCIGQLITSAFEETEKNVEAKKRLLLFCLYFYEMLLQNWLSEHDLEHIPPHPLSNLKTEGIPEEISLSHFSINKTDCESKHQEILDELKKGKDFSELALAYADDVLVRHSGGRIGWIKIGELPSEQEPAVFLFQQEDRSFLLTTEDNYHFFLIHERNFAQKTSFLECSALLLAQRREADSLRLAYLSLLNPLKTVIENFHSAQFRISRENEIDKINRHYQKALPYLGMFAFSKESVTLV